MVVVDHDESPPPPPPPSDLNPWDANCVLIANDDGEEEVPFAMNDTITTIKAATAMNSMKVKDDNEEAPAFKAARLPSAPSSSWVTKLLRLGVLAFFRCFIDDSITNEVSEEGVEEKGET